MAADDPETGWRARGSGRELPRGADAGGFPAPQRLSRPWDGRAPLRRREWADRSRIARGGSPVPGLKARFPGCAARSAASAALVFSGKPRFALAAAILKLRFFQTRHPGILKQNQTTNPDEFPDTGPRNSASRGHGICVSAPSRGNSRRTQDHPQWVPVWTPAGLGSPGR